MAFKEMIVRIDSEAPLLMHSGRMIDPLDEYARALKKISGKRIKTEADYEEMARIEWYASLYVRDGKVVIPSEVIEATLVNGAKKTKSGKTAQAGLFVKSDMVLEFPAANKTTEQLWEDAQYRFSVPVRVGNARVIRTRPRFDTWGGAMTVVFDDSLFNESQVQEIIIVSGEQVALCDWRPKFGRFNTTFK